MPITAEQRATPADRQDKDSLYRNQQKGLIYPENPIFSSVEEERQHRKERLVASCRAFALEKFDYAFAGHLTVRDPENPDLYWRTAF